MSLSENDPQTSVSTEIKSSISKPLDWHAAAVASSSNHPALKTKMANELMGTIYFAEGTSTEDKIKKTNALLEMAASMQPADAMEAQLIAQMTGAHNIAMDLMARANRPGLQPQSRALQMKHAEKFMRIYSEQMRTLEKYRARHARQIVVEQVNVQSGGQAIVGVVTPAGALNNASSGTGQT